MPSFTNAFGGTFAFLQPHKANQKKQKNDQANAPKTRQINQTRKGRPIVGEGIV